MSDFPSGEHLHGRLAPLILHHWDEGHADLPWRTAVPDPYAVWVSEIMAQQTQLGTVIPYFERWMVRFPTVADLAAAPLDEVLKLWEGLGYYSRARNLHAAAQVVVGELGGEIPQTAKELQKLKGIGRYTAGAIASVAFGEPAAVLDGNVIRVLSRLLDLEANVTQTATKKFLWDMAEQLVPDQRPGDYNQGLMELGQKVCTPAAPSCHLCPVAELCLARERGTQMERPVKPPRKKTPHYDVAAGVIWREKVGEGQFLIAQRPLDGLLGGLWEFPGGKQEAGETLPETLVREIWEELGIVIEVVEERPFIAIKHAYTHFKITLHTFYAIAHSGTVRHLGVADHAWVTLAELDQYAFAVTDRKVISALRGEGHQPPLL